MPSTINSCPRTTTQIFDVEVESAAIDKSASLMRFDSLPEQALLLKNFKGIAGCSDPAGSSDLVGSYNTVVAACVWTLSLTSRRQAIMREMHVVRQLFQFLEVGGVKRPKRELAMVDGLEIKSFFRMFTAVFQSLCSAQSLSPNSANS